MRGKRQKTCRSSETIFALPSIKKKQSRTIPSRYPLNILKHSFNDMLITHELPNKERKCFVFSNQLPQF